MPRADPSSSRSEKTVRLHERLRQGPPVVLDGAGGTALEDQGVDTSGPLWSAEALGSEYPRVVGLHAAYAQAGAEVHTAVTFRTHPGLFEQDGGREAWRSTLEAGIQAVVEGVKQAGVARDSVWIAGSMAPVGESYAPEKVPSDAVMEKEHGAQADGLAAAGADLLLVETMVTVREARIAVEAARKTGLPVWVGFVVGPDTRILSGEPLEEAVKAAVQAGAHGVLINCSSLENTLPAVRVLQEVSPVPWGAYANGSTGDPASGWGERVGVDRYQSAVEDWLQAGAKVVGSCCATGPEHTWGIAQAVRRHAKVGTGEGKRVRAK